MDLSTQVPIRCTVTMTIQCDIDVTQKAALHNKCSQVIQDLKAQFPDKITDNQITIHTVFAPEQWKV